MSAENSIIGVKEIKMGACGAAGTVGATLVAIGDIVPDSVNLVFDEPGKTDLFVEDYDTAFYSIPDPAVPRRLEFSTRDMSAATLTKLFGGTTTTDKWDAPTSMAAIEQSITVQTKDVSGYHKLISIPRALIRASLDGKMQKKDSAVIKVVAELLTPFDATPAPLPAIFIDKVAAS